MTVINVIILIVAPPSLAPGSRALANRLATSLGRLQLSESTEKIEIQNSLRRNGKDLTR